MMNLIEFSSNPGVNFIVKNDRLASIAANVLMLLRVLRKSKVQVLSQTQLKAFSTKKNNKKFFIGISAKISTYLLVLPVASFRSK